MRENRTRALKFLGGCATVVTLAWAVAYNFKFPPPQRLILRSQLSELRKLKDDCEREKRETGELYHQYDYPTMIQCAEHHYRWERQVEAESK